VRTAKQSLLLLLLLFFFFRCYSQQPAILSSQRHGNQLSASQMGEWATRVCRMILLTAWQKQGTLNHSA
jgi:hypothetical protein